MAAFRKCTKTGYRQDELVGESRQPHLSFGWQGLDLSSKINSAMLVTPVSWFAVYCLRYHW